MALPQAFAAPEEYFEECVAFLQRYQRLYNFANTDILVHKVLDDINMENIENVDIFDKDFKLPAEAHRNTFLRDFFDGLDRLKAVHNDFIEETGLENKVDMRLSSKKRHEIAYLAKELNGACAQTGCDTVVDFGSGLGYLDQLLFESNQLKVLGLECNENHYVNAKRRQIKYHKESVENVKYIKHFISEDSDSNIREYLEDKFKGHGEFCITGLHACADLTIDAMNLFLKMPAAKSMIIMPCCYHKMATKDLTEGRFKNFPLSNGLKSVFDRYRGHEFMRVPFLRLAAQPPCRTEDNLESAVFNLLARAVLQLYANKHDCKLKRKKRKAVKMKELDNDFGNYVQDATTNGFSLMSNNSENVNTYSWDFHTDDLQLLWREIAEEMTFKKAAIFILLQNYFQPVIENFILFDRVVYMKEMGLENCTFRKIFNETVSPRCLALFVCK